MMGTLQPARRDRHCCLVLRQRKPTEAEVWESVHSETPHEQGSHGQGGPREPSQPVTDPRQRMSELTQAIEADPTNKRLIIERINLAIAIEPPLAIRECQKILHTDTKNHFALQHIASAYLEAGDYDKALHYAVLASQQMETVSTRNIIAQVFYRRGMFDKAMLHYEKALAIDPANEHALAAVAMIKAAQSKGR